MSFELLHSNGWPKKQGLYDPAFEHDACGVGFVAHIKGERSRQIIVDADEMLKRMTHRGACGCEENTGDGAGILTALPYEFLEKVAKNELKATLPARDRYGAGIVFLPQDPAEREVCKQTVNTIIAEQGQTLIGWRHVPTDPDAANIGPSARACEPAMEMLVVGADEGLDQAGFDRKLFIIRKLASHRLRDESKLKEALQFYICSLSTRIMIYKGMLMPSQVMPYFKDLRDPDYKSHLAMIHSRFSTDRKSVV